MHDFTALDVETANRNRYSICSIGMVNFKDGRQVDSFYTLIDPEDYFDPSNIRIHGIKESDVQGAPTFSRILTDMNDFIGDKPVVAHNAQFDFGALKDNYSRYQVALDPIQYACSYLISKSLRKDFINHRLNTLCHYYQIDLSHHHALSDASAAGMIINHLMAENRLDNIDQLIRFAGYRQYGLLGRRGFRKR